MRSNTAFLLALVSGLAGLAPAGLSGCKEPSSAGADPSVADYLMPAGKNKAELLMERRFSGPGKKSFVQPRLVVVERSREGVVYRIRERIGKDEWRTAAQLFFVARPNGAYLGKQFNLVGEEVGVKGERLMFPWPSKAGDERVVRYRIHGRRHDGGASAKGLVKVLREGFSEKVGARAVGPCLEVREELVPDVGGKLDLTSVFCKGVGRVRITQRNETLSRGESTIVDQVITIRD